jgi:uncharacterized protein with PIN domain
MAYCPHCSNPASSVRANRVKVHPESTLTDHDAVAYSCASCGKVLGVGSIRNEQTNEIIEGLIRKLRQG